MIFLLDIYCVYEYMIKTNSRYLIVHLLDELFKIPELNWLGTCNELNGAYAADGYARIRGLPSVLVTTYAVGELSAMNGVAGAYAEHAGMIHIVGMPARASKSDRLYEYNVTYRLTSLL